MNKNGIRNLNIEGNDQISKISFTFGPHHFLEVAEESDGEVKFTLGSTHHGFTANANDGLPTELENFIESIREKYPENRID